MNIVLRPMTDKDRSFIYSTWLNGVFYDITETLRPDPKKYFPQKSKRIEALLNNPEVRICVASDADDSLWIAGYSISLGQDLYWIYVRKDFRKQGLAKMLLANQPIKYVRNLTKIGAELSEKHGLIFRPEKD